MLKYTQKSLKELIRLGLAVDITAANTTTREELEAKEGYLTQVGYSSGVYGCNGALLQGHNTGECYAITSRSTALFVFV